MRPSLQQGLKSAPFRHLPSPRSANQPKLSPTSVFSGIQPTGIPHLGNYLGALRPWVDIQNKAASDPQHQSSKLLFCIVDLHALTGVQNREELERNRRESFLSLMAVGLSPQHSTLFLQSSVNETTTLMWILSTVASTGYLSRMTQWKSKLALPEDATLTDAAAIEKLKLGLFSYPVLQAADILLYKPEIVPVGDDQKQHIEFARTLARSFNAAYCPEDTPLFKPPTVQISPAKRIMSLRKPTQKMSKSDPDPKSRILITDSEESIREKLKAAKTDSEVGITYDPVNRPGIANLIDIFRHTSRNATPPEEIAKEFHDREHRMVDLKNMVAEAVVKELKPVRERFQYLGTTREGMQEVTEAYNKGMNVARGKATETITKVRHATGLSTLKWDTVDEFSREDFVALA